ncbi:MAG: RNA-binding protein [Treponema sp. GWB1_62_6]|nr:MAG: RNA-binding protein [Treponema sp. GWA1_62_8]OHE63103.1 MAG: RNA-binding protein [Treponema sp. GWC1_61_84]OHE71230.1 MAG: RNA-binding protein [Treponema sp. GWB1_62_6]HCM26187.1 ribosome assembly RNA-binding protein YhbY [Treponema sp.]
MLTSKQRSLLSSLAATLDPTIMVGKEGPSDALAKALAAEFKIRELVKVRFIGEKENRREHARGLAERTGAELVRVIGNVAVMYRRADEAERRLIVLPR